MDFSSEAGHDLLLNDNEAAAVTQTAGMLSSRCGCGDRTAFLSVGKPVVQGHEERFQVTKFLHFPI